MHEALKPLRRLEAKAREGHVATMKQYSWQADVAKAARDEALKRSKKGGEPVAPPDEIEKPRERRYLINDTSYEKLGEVLADNPHGTLAFRDELVSLLRTLDREEYCAARGFFLTAWSGTASYTFDRIMRGKTHIERACLSLIGSTQPSMIGEYVGKANRGGASDDGMLQRFSLAVWPDPSGTWKEIDQFPDNRARDTAWETFTRLDALTASDVGAEREEYDDIPFLRLSEAASGYFKDWRVDLETKLRSGEHGEALESHLAKYRKMVPALALINHLADGGTGPISETAMVRALGFSVYLQSHAVRLYGAKQADEVATAKAILKHVRRGALADGFTSRDVMRPCWSGLTDLERVKRGLGLLAELGWLRPATAQTGGRPTTGYWINPKVRS